MMKRAQGFTLFETALVLIIASFAVAAVSFGFLEYRRQLAVTDAVELVGSVQRSAQLQDPVEPLSIAGLVAGIDERFRSSLAPGNLSASVAGFRGGTASVWSPSTGGIEVRFDGVDREACGQMVSRLWPMVDGIRAGRFGGELVALKQTALGDEQAIASSAAVKQGCIDGTASRTVVVALAAGFPPAPSGSSSGGGKEDPLPGNDEPVIEDPLPPPPPPPPFEEM